MIGHRKGFGALNNLIRIGKAFECAPNFFSFFFAKNYFDEIFTREDTQSQVFQKHSQLTSADKVSNESLSLQLSNSRRKKKSIFFSKFLNFYKKNYFFDVIFFCADINVRFQQMRYQM